jgi:hypothetical protein
MTTDQLCVYKYFAIVGRIPSMSGFPYRLNGNAENIDITNVQSSLPRDLRPLLFLIKSISCVC